jgi:hypothetical protein
MGSSGKMVSSLFQMTSIVVIKLLGASYDGIIVARLPITPVWPFSIAMHRGLDDVSDDMCDISYLGIYVISQMCLKPVLSKLIGIAPDKKGTGSMMPTMPEPPAAVADKSY